MLTICKCLGPLDRSPSRACAAPGRGSATRSGDNWVWEWSCVSSTACTVCTGAATGGGEGCLINVTGGATSTERDDWELGQSAGSERESKEATVEETAKLVDTASLVDEVGAWVGTFQSWIKLHPNAHDGKHQKIYYSKIQHRQRKITCQTFNAGYEQLHCLEKNWRYRNNKCNSEERP